MRPPIIDPLKAAGGGLVVNSLSVWLCMGGLVSDQLSWEPVRGISLTARNKTRNKYFYAPSSCLDRPLGYLLGYLKPKPTLSRFLSTLIEPCSGFNIVQTRSFNTSPKKSTTLFHDSIHSMSH